MPVPARKRMRLSSPTYDEGDDLGSDDLKELDRIELTLSQLQRQQPSSSQRIPQSSQMFSPGAKQRRLKAIMEGLHDSGGSDSSETTGEKRTRDTTLGFKSAAGLSDLASVKDKYDHEPSSSSQEEPLPEKDYSTWFNPIPDASMSLPGFQVVSKTHLALSSDDTIESASVAGFTSANQSFNGFGFASAVNIKGSVLEPSKEALERAAKKLQDWSAADESEDLTVDVSLSPLKPGSEADILRPVLASVSNSPSFRPVKSPTKPSDSSRFFSTPLLSRVGGDKTRVFKSPLLGHASPRTLYPKAGSGSLSPSKSGSVLRGLRPHPLSSIPITGEPAGLQTPDRSARAMSESALQFTTPVRPGALSGLGSASRPLKPAFSTPFKKGMKPGDPGRVAFDKDQQEQRKEAAKSQKPLSKRNGKAESSSKLALKDSGLMPQNYTREELEDMGVNISELSQITPQTAPFYVFHTLASHAPSTQTQAASRSAGLSLGPSEALSHLHDSGRTTATREWVDNHWALILWKLAGLAAVDPARESTSARRWCWSAVLAQLEGRYDKEFGRGMRSALRLITTGDAPAGSPLVLVITAVLYSEGEEFGPRGNVTKEASAELEVSDGWYRLRAQADAPVARAVVRGLIKPGRKIAMAGAKLDNNKKDPCEVLEAYDSCSLLLSGNGTHLAPWHVKLGFQAQPFIATLGSLTADGGPIPIADFIVEKVHPVAFFETISGPKPGEKRREGPSGQAEEAEKEEAWRKRRDAEESKLREELNARWGRWDGFSERLERAAGGRFNPSEDEMPPDHIEDLFDDLDTLAPTEIGEFIRNLSPVECGWLARYLRRRVEKDQDLAGEEIEGEMKHLCPPREVRNFRIVQVRDARTVRRPANRIAHLCIWDVLALCISEGGKAGALEPGQRFLMTSLMPMQQKCWMGHAKDDMVYLSTTRGSRFIRLK